MVILINSQYTIWNHGCMLNKVLPISEYLLYCLLLYAVEQKEKHSSSEQKTALRTLTSADFLNSSVMGWLTSEQ